MIHTWHRNMSTPGITQRQSKYWSNLKGILQRRLASQWNALQDSTWPMRNMPLPLAVLIRRECCSLELPGCKADKISETNT